MIKLNFNTLLVFACIFICCSLKAQDSTELSFQQIQENIMDILNQSDEEINLEELTDYLYQLVAQPVKINTAKSAEIRRLFWLTDNQVNNLIQYIINSGEIQSVYEIANINGFDSDDARLLKPFITFEMQTTQITSREYFAYPRQLLIIRTNRVLEQQAGFNKSYSNGFVGSPGSFYSKYHIYNEHFSAGITGDKDSGEEFFTGSNAKGFDFYSFHFQLNQLGFVKTIVLGDYKLNFGNGLITGSAFNLGKNPSLLSSAYQYSGVTRYTATNENSFFRGLATTFFHKNKELSLFYSNHRMDANIIVKDTVTGEILEVSSLQTTGYHTTYSELADEHALQNQTIGGHLKFNGNYSEIGITAMFNKFSASINPVPETYNLDYFRGKENYNLGLNFRIRTGVLLWFGEEAYCQNGSMAFLNGIQLTPVSNTLVNIIYRNYYPKYQALFGNAFGENSRNQNERGIYAGFQSTPVKYFTFIGYADFFSFPKMKYGVDMPSQGFEYMGSVVFKPRMDFQAYFQYRYKQKEVNNILENTILAKVVPSITEHVRIGINYKASNNINLRNRLEFSNFKKNGTGNTKGYLLSQDIDFNLVILPAKLYVRYAMFDCEDYDSRIYAYESDVLYAFNIPSFYDKGYRFCGMLKISAFQNSDLWVKYSMTKYTDRESISSGLYEIQGDQKSEIRIQMLFRLGNKRKAKNAY